MALHYLACAIYSVLPAAAAECVPSNKINLFVVVWMYPTVLHL